jgi:hypothetical protein
MSRLILGIPLKYILVVLVVVFGGATVAGTGALVVALAVVPDAEVEEPVIEIVFDDPASDPITMVVPFSSPVLPTTTLPITPPVVITITVPITPPIVPTDTVPITPTVVPTKPGISGLVFHPAHLNAGGKCAEVYSAQGSLKNHGPAMATGVVIGYEVVSGAEWVDHVEVTPAEWPQLGTSKPARFSVSVYTNDEWALAGKGARIEVRLFVEGQAGVVGDDGPEATFVVKNQCKPDKLEKPEKPVKPEKPAKPEKPKPAKPEKPVKPKKDK